MYGLTRDISTGWESEIQVFPVWLLRTAKEGSTLGLMGFSKPSWSRASYQTPTGWDHSNPLGFGG